VFTGIVEELGTVVAVRPGDEGAEVTIRGPRVTSDTRPGDSIAVNGVCLTAVAVDGDTFTADVMRETLRRSTLGRLRPGEAVNLERALTLSSRLGGHLVQGHVDGVGTVRERRPGPSSEDLRVELPAGLERYVVEKGSITVDGVSLTVVAVADGWFEVSLIPTTLAATTLGRRQVGDPVNLEVDVLAKYVERLLAGSGERPTGQEVRR
jgi:riboflavin synthase